MYRLKKLLSLDRKLFHTGDLATLWGIINKNTLYTTIKRYKQKGILFPIYKGLYSTVPITKLDPLMLGKTIIHRYTYLSLESVLAQKGATFQAVNSYTFVTDISKQVTLDQLFFSYRQLAPQYLFNLSGIEDQNGLLIATVERAIADMLYFNPKYYFDLNFGINWQKVKKIQKEVGYI